MSNISKLSKAVVGAAQMRATNDKTANLEQVKLLIHLAKKLDVKFLFLPECCDFIGENRQETLALSQPLDQAILPYKTLAKENQMWISLGGIHESVLDSCCKKTDKIYNAHVVINSNGDEIKTYRKLHMFDAATPEVCFRESDSVSKGDRIVPPIDTPIGKLGMQICYDVRFAEPSIVLRKNGAEILSYPSAFTFPTGQAHWEVLLRARAIENQCYVIAPAQIGFHNSKRQSYGYAMVVCPWGTILSCCGEKELDVATANIDLSKLHKIRQNLPCFEHRRSDVYNLTAIETADLENVDRPFGPHIVPKCTIFLETPLSYAFTNLRCIVEGHVLVSTKRVVPRLKDLSRDEICDLFSTVCKVKKMLEEFYCTSAGTLNVQDGFDAGQSINHVHVHVMPRRAEDFGENVDVYVKLLKMDGVRDRDISDMIAEAQKYRSLIYTK